MFHLPHLWDVRQNPDLFLVTKILLKNNDNLWVDTNRSIEKLPKMGENAFLHWDLDMFRNGQKNVFSSCDGNSGFSHDLIFVEVSEWDDIVWFIIFSVCKWFGS